MKKFLFYLVQFTWALPQNLVGGIGFLALRKKYKHERFNNAFVTYVPQSTTPVCTSTATRSSRFCSDLSGLL